MFGSSERAGAMNATMNGRRAGLLRLLSRNRTPVQGVLDAGAWTFGITFATLARFDFDLGRVDPAAVAMVVAFAAGLQVLVGALFGLYTGHWRYGSFEEVAALGRAVGCGTIVLFALNIVLAPQPLPRSVPLAGGIAAFVAMGGTRYVWRLALERMRRPSARNGATRMLVFGAGEGATQALGAMLRDPASPYVPVALLDDDPGKRKLRLMGVPVVGSREDIAEAARRFEADTLLVAVPSASGELIGELADRAADAGLQVKVLPPVAELLGQVGVSDIRPITERDLLGRHEIEIDLEQVARYLTGRRVLVTGAGGSIGSELCRQIHTFDPARLVMLDRDESALHAVQLSIDGQGRLEESDLVLCDIRDRECIQETFRRHRPEVVFHAAALKHVPILEQHPEEAVKTNVWGTLHTLEAASACGVERFVNISTDKAADPQNVLGYTKRIAERLTAHFGQTQPGTYLSVRFGNVLGSRGSVLTTIRKQIADGGPVTITHPDVTRYFMTVEEAVQLVVQAGVVGSDGEVLVLDMGTPVRIAEVAERLVAQSEHRIEISYTGLRAGEKMHEVLFGPDEHGEQRAHPLISHVLACPLDREAAAAIRPNCSPAALVAELRQLCGAEDPRRDLGSALKQYHQ